MKAEYKQNPLEREEKRSYSIKEIFARLVHLIHDSGYLPNPIRAGSIMMSERAVDRSIVSVRNFFAARPRPWRPRRLSTGKHHREGLRRELIKNLRREAARRQVAR